MLRCTDLGTSANSQILEARLHPVDGFATGRRRQYFRRRNREKDAGAIQDRAISERRVHTSAPTPTMNFRLGTFELRENISLSEK